jgi:two-component system sensor histidine kinase EvgS
MEDLEDYFTIEGVDNGEGIATEDQEKEFEMFYRASVSSSGTGLGLYLCKELINKMKGEIRLNSRKGFGTQIKVTLPKSYSNE